MKVMDEIVDFMFCTRAELVLPLEAVGLRNPAHGDYIKWSPVKLSLRMLEKDHTLSSAVKYPGEEFILLILLPEADRPGFKSWLFHCDLWQVSSPLCASSVNWGY